ncbi:MAG: hypothetical protein KF770_28685, partial [Anaerolineae bacterium]|nr:hypothetical protein [Anaerolineae bacterium]
RAEGVQHLEDLLLRRLRLGLLLPEGGRAHLPRIRAICQAELGWDDGRWQDEEAAYLALWQHCYSLPPLETIPDWRVMLAQVEMDTAVTVHQPTRRTWIAGVLLGAAVALTAVWLWRRNR